MPATTGTKLQAFCSKCKTDTDHTVMEADDKGKRITSVRCDTCKDAHAFRKPKSARVARASKPPKAPKPPAKSRRAKTAEQQASDEWSEVESVVGAAQRTPYAMNRGFDKGQVIEHAVFGPGLVLAVLGPRKIEVVFRLGRRRLVCGLGKT